MVQVRRDERMGSILSAGNPPRTPGPMTVMLGDATTRDVFPALL